MEQRLSELVPLGLSDQALGGVVFAMDLSTFGVVPGTE